MSAQLLRYNIERGVLDTLRLIAVDADRQLGMVLEACAITTLTEADWQRVQTTDDDATLLTLVSQTALGGKEVELDAAAVRKLLRCRLDLQFKHDK